MSTDVFTLLHEAARLGVTIQEVGGRLRVEGPPDARAALLPELREHRDEVLGLLRVRTFVVEPDGLVLERLVVDGAVGYSAVRVEPPISSDEDVGDLLWRCSAGGVALVVHEDELLVSGRALELGELLPLVRAHRGELLEALTPAPTEDDFGLELLGSAVLPSGSTLCVYRDSDGGEWSHLTWEHGSAWARATCDDHNQVNATSAGRSPSGRGQAAA